MHVSKRNTKAVWVDPDDAPELTQEWFDTADVYDGERLISRGRPKSLAPKKAVSLRLDPEVIDKFKAEGPGWQGRMNEALRKAVGL